MAFHNPYHFVPVKPGSRPDDLSVADFEKGASGYVTHDKFVSEIAQGSKAQPIYAGRLLCRLITKGPVIIGNLREELKDHSHRGHPLEPGGVPIIPATTLRGLISSIAEAASNSALRILENRKFFEMNKSLKDAGSTYDYFRQLALKPRLTDQEDLLPFSKDRRHNLTIAEQLFGFVEQRDPQTRNSSSPILALASRVRFSFGLYSDPNDPCKDDPYEEEVLLKILDKPKPSYPAFYFKRRDGKGGHIAKSELCPNLHIPQGRKFYLHQRANQITPWKTGAEQDRLDQKSRVRPLKPECVFYFHIDFENLQRVTFAQQERRW